LIGHFSADELASYRAGTTSATRASKIAAHLAGCVRCAGVDASLANVSALLASVPAQPMPDRLTDRVSAALAAESAHRATALTAAAVSTSAGTAPAAAASPTGQAGRLRTAGATSQGAPSAADAAPPGYHRWRLRMPEWSSPLVLRSLAATGVLVLLAGGGFLLASAHHGQGTATSGPIAARGPRKAVNPGDHSANVSASGGVRYRYKGTYLVANTIQSRANYTVGDLASGVRAVVASTPAISPATPGPQVTSGTNSNSTAAPLVRIGGISASQLTGCLSNIASGRAVLLADVAHYLGKPAVIIVLKPVSAVFDVIVVGLACTATKADAITRLSLPKS
jgi:hypothetical protein